MAGIQINFTPFAPRILFDTPAVELAHRTHDLAEISRPIAAELHERVNEATTWSARFDAIDEVLVRAVHEGTRPRPEVVRLVEADRSQSRRAARLTCRRIGSVGADATSMECSVQNSASDPRKRRGSCDSIGRDE